MTDERIDIKSVIIAPKAEWQEQDPIMSKGLLLMEKGTTKTKLADGEHKWSELRYFTGGENSSPIDADLSYLEEAVAKLREDLTALGNDVDALNSEIGDKADDDVVVHRKGVTAETVEGNKAFDGTCISRSSEVPADKPDELITAGYLETAHNQSGTAHSDIRDSITALNNNLNNLIITGGVDQYGVEADYAIHHGILDCPNGLIEHTQNNKQISIQPGIVLQAAGNPLRTTLASGLTYTVKETGKVVLFYAEGGNILEAGAVYYQEAEPVNGDIGYLAWYKPSLGKWQFKSDDTGNVFREAVATPIANVNAGEDGIISINYVGYRIVDDDCPAQMSDIDALEEKITMLNDTLNPIAGNTLFTTFAQTVPDVASDADLATLITAYNGLLAALRTRGIVG